MKKTSAAKKLLKSAVSVGKKALSSGAPQKMAAAAVKAKLSKKSGGAPAKVKGRPFMGSRRVGIRTLVKRKLDQRARFKLRTGNIAGAIKDLNKKRRV